MVFYCIFNLQCFPYICTSCLYKCTRLMRASFIEKNTIFQPESKELLCFVKPVLRFHVCISCEGLCTDYVICKPSVTTADMPHIWFIFDSIWSHIWLPFELQHRWNISRLFLLLVRIVFSDSSLNELCCCVCFGSPSTFKLNPNLLAVNVSNDCLLHQYAIPWKEVFHRDPLWKVQDRCAWCSYEVRPPHATFQAHATLLKH